MSLFEYLELQPVGDSDLDEYNEDENIDLTQDTSGAELDAAWDRISHDMHEN